VLVWRDAAEKRECDEERLEVCCVASISGRYDGGDARAPLTGIICQNLANQIAAFFRTELKLPYIIGCPQC
jgi:hypothetical protein